MKARPIVFLLVLAGLLSGCQGSAPQPAAPTPAEPTSTPDSAPAVEPTPAEASLLHAGEEPLRFTFPTPGSQPVSLWRPPLYEVPWALSQNDHFYFSRPIAADEINWPLADYR